MKINWSKIGNWLSITQVKYSKRRYVEDFMEYFYWDKNMKNPSPMSGLKEKD